MQTRPKGFPLEPGPDVGWNLFDDGVAYPVAVLVESALRQNAAAMRAFCERNGVSLAPHGKTTMAPVLLRRQLDDGAWAITAATAWQAKAMRDVGVPRVLLANEVVVPAEIAWLAEATADGFEVYCYVDSVAAVDLMTTTLAGLGATRRLPVLLELGVVGGRTGVRSVVEGLRVAEAAAASPHLALTGTAGFEGVISGSDQRSTIALVDEFLDGIVELTHAVAGSGWFDPTPEVVVSAGGSTYFDRVVDRFDHVGIEHPVRVVLRSGCYLAHDDGTYSDSSPMGVNPRVGDGRLAAAIEVWGAVVSRPEPTRALVGIGRRDVSHDGLLPVAKKVRRRGSTTIETVAPIRVSVLNDQHAYLDVEPADALAVGDLVAFGISHPCTTFDKWRAMAVVDDAYTVVEMIETMF